MLWFGWWGLRLSPCEAGQPRPCPSPERQYGSVVCHGLWAVVNGMCRGSAVVVNHSGPVTP